jgi:hypothetical protein
MNERFDRIEDLMVILSEEIRETRNLTIAVQKETMKISEQNELTKELALAAAKKADAAWELVVMTRNELSKPFWKRSFGY